MTRSKLPLMGFRIHFNGFTFPVILDFVYISVSQIDIVFHGKPLAVTRLTQAASINVDPSGWSCPVSCNFYPSREESKQLFALALSYC